MRWSELSSVLAFLSLSFISLATTAAKVEEIEALDRAELLEQESFKNIEYRLVLSELKRIEAITVGEIERFIVGDVSRQLWQASSSHELSDVLAHYRQQLPEAQVLYSCHGLDCGSSNFWANKIFMNAKLYGRDAKQDYVVLFEPAKSKKQNHTLYVIYAVQRSKQKTYFNIDVIKTRDAVTDEEVQRQQIINTLQTESGWLEGMAVVDGRIDEEQSAILISTIKSLDASLKRRLYLVVHCYQANNMADNFACSTRLSQQLRALIYDSDFEVPVYGHGALTLPPSENLKPQLRFMLWPRQ